VLNRTRLQLIALGVMVPLGVLVTGSIASAEDQKGEAKEEQKSDGGVLKGAATGAAAGALLPGVTAGQGAAIGAVAGGVKKAKDNNEKADDKKD
jgi:TctA family transporter